MAQFAFSEIMDGLPVVKVVDIGPATENAGSEPYAPLVKRGLARVVGYDASAEDCAQLNERSGGRHLYHAEIIGDGSPATFHVCRNAAGSSLYEPDAELLSLFQDLEAVGDVIERRQVTTRRLDDCPDANGADFLRLDAAGAALAIFEGAGQVLDECVLVHIAVDFVPLYKNQPLFADADTALRRLGFAFHKLTALGGRCFKPLVIGIDANDPLSQMLSAEAVYVRNFADLAGLSADKLLKLALILHEVYGSYDLCAHVLRYFDAQIEGGLWPAYVRRLTGARTPRGSAFA